MMMAVRDGLKTNLLTATSVHILFSFKKLSAKYLFLKSEIQKSGSGIFQHEATGSSSAVYGMSDF